MNQRIFIATTSTASLRPLVWQGVRASTCYAQFFQILQRRLHPPHQALLAEPFPDSQGESIDWYACLPGNIPAQQPLKLSELPQDAQEEARKSLHQLISEIHTLSLELGRAADSNSAAAARLLEKGLIFPGEEYVYLIGKQPVIIAWGYLPEQENTTQEPLSRMRETYASALPLPGQASSATPCQPGTDLPEPGTTLPHDKAMPQGARWEQPHGSAQPLPASAAIAPGRAARINLPRLAAWFGLGAGLMALLLAFWGGNHRLYQAGQPGQSGCSRISLYPADDSPNKEVILSGTAQEILREQGREETLRAELDLLRQEHYLRRLQCQEKPEAPEAAEPEPAPPPTEEEKQKPEEKTVPEQAEAPPLPQLALPELPPDPPPAPKRQPKAEAVPAPQAENAPKTAPPAKPKSNYLEIPDDPDDLSFLEGCWEAEIAPGTPGRNAYTNQRLVYCFDAGGNGQGILSERGSGRRLCVGGAKGRLNGDTLQIADMPPLRPSSCVRESMICKNAASGVAQCSSQFETGGTSKLVFRRR